MKLRDKELAVCNGIILLGLVAIFMHWYMIAAMGLVYTMYKLGE